ncbi:MAG: mechanosensitive ion channel protein, partial [Gammaproteobacteria bacterium]|nr:mechanosensitive ion channel protein [Gammaproteobacteria bacterium]
MDTNLIQEKMKQLTAEFVDILSSPEFYSQISIIVFAIIMAYAFFRMLDRHSPLLKPPVKKAPLFWLRDSIYQIRNLLFPLFIILFMVMAVDFSDHFIRQSWLVRLAQGLAVVVMIYSIITRFVSNLFIKAVFKWIAIPIALLQIFGWLDNVI